MEDVNEFTPHLISMPVRPFPPQIMLILRFDTAQKMKFSIKHFFSKCDQIRSFLRIWSRLLKKPLSGKLHFLYSVKYSNHIDIGRKLFGNLSSTISDILFSMQEVLATITKFMTLLAFLGTVH